VVRGIGGAADYIGTSEADDVAQLFGVNADVLDLDAALSRLASLDPRKSQIAELRFFGGEP
jgi:hypothetical protein